MDEGETLDHAAARELQEETGLDPKDFPFHQVSNLWGLISQQHNITIVL